MRFYVASIMTRLHILQKSNRCVRVASGAEITKLVRTSITVI
jgi:hypothetical protein